MWWKLNGIFPIKNSVATLAPSIVHRVSERAIQKTEYKSNRKNVPFATTTMKCKVEMADTNSEESNDGGDNNTILSYNAVQRHSNLVSRPDHRQRPCLLWLLFIHLYYKRWQVFVATVFVWIDGDGENFRVLLRKSRAFFFISVYFLFIVNSWNF